MKKKKFHQRKLRKGERKTKSKIKIKSKDFYNNPFNKTYNTVKPRKGSYTLKRG